MTLDHVWVNARSLRNASTDAERALWQHLRGRQLAGFKFRRQFPIAGFIADFACVDARLVIELDGGQHADRQDQDARRTARMMVNGYRVLRFWNHDVLARTDAVLEEILRHLSTPPQPSPAGRGGGNSDSNSETRDP